jgi:transposase-like protein
MGSRGPRSAYTHVACPNETCAQYGQVNQGNIASNGTKRTRDGPRRNFLCRTCGACFCERAGTAFYDLRTAEDKVLLAIRLLLEGMSLRAIARVLEVKLDTVRLWLRRCAEHAEAVNERLVRDIGVSRVELDELWTFVRKKGLRQWQQRQREKGRTGCG